MPTRQVTANIFERAVPRRVSCVLFRGAPADLGGNNSGARANLTSPPSSQGRFPEASAVSAGDAGRRCGVGLASSTKPARLTEQNARPSAQTRAAPIRVPRRSLVTLASARGNLAMKALSAPLTRTIRHPAAADRCHPGCRAGYQHELRSLRPAQMPMLITKMLTLLPWPWSICSHCCKPRCATADAVGTRLLAAAPEARL